MAMLTKKQLVYENIAIKVITRVFLVLVFKIKYYGYTVNVYIICYNGIYVLQLDKATITIQGLWLYLQRRNGYKKALPSKDSPGSFWCLFVT